MDERTEFLRNATAWAIDHLGIDGGLSLKQQRETWAQLLRALRGQPCIATAYVPPHHTDAGRVYHADNQPDVQV